MPRYQKILILLVLIIGLGFSLDIIATLKAESLWFQEIGYLGVFVKALTNKVIIWLLTFLISGGFLFLNIFLARKFRHSNLAKQKEKLLNRESLSKKQPHKTVFRFISQFTNWFNLPPLQSNHC